MGVSDTDSKARFTGHRAQGGFGLAWFIRALGLIALSCAVATMARAEEAPARAASGAGLMVAPDLQAALEQGVAEHEAGRLARAQAIFEALARRQVPAAEFDLALMHLEGEVARPDLVLAHGLLQRAGEAGFVHAQLLLAQALEGGRFGARDLAQAHRWYALAAAAGSVDAQVAMGTDHYLGRGLPQDMAAAAGWFRAAANGGDVGAMYLLASMYEHGEGLAQDLRLAHYWYAQAGQNGDVLGQAKAREMAQRLKAEPD
jgi:TPR repeat protein